MKLKHKTTIITGATSGIGKATALLFADQGADLVLTGRRLSLGKAVEDPALKSLGVTFTLVDPSRRTGSAKMFGGPADKSVSATIAGNIDAIASVSIVDAAGKKLSNSAMWTDEPAARNVSYQLDAALPADAALQIEVWPGQKTLTVPFELNLSKSLLILWLMSVLVTAVAIFCSTFLSWPIAVVLTLVILLGHWGVGQISDSLGSAMGDQVATDLFGANAGAAARAKVVSQSVNALSTALKAFATVLPDISQYSATEDIERGITIPVVRLRDAATVTFGFGIPLVVLAYVLLRNKEVAP